MILDGKKLKEKILENLKQEVSKLNEKPMLCVIQIGDDTPSNIYINQKRKMCEYIGYGFIHEKLNENVSQDYVLELIDKLNNDTKITSILIQMPVPSNIDSKTIQNRVKKEKDVDGLNDKNVIDLLNNRDCLIPCTANGVLDLLNEYNINVEGKHVVMIGRSSLVGMPLFHLLENKNATVTLCHSKTQDLKSITKNAEILIVATGNKHLITQDMIKEGSIVIDVGINKVNGKLYGDVDFENIKDKAKYITPVPGGVGPMTIASLAKNILKSYKIQKDID